ncbi:NET1-associated nuclear protein 1 [Didymosphaeria variabile]|uniref:NET1-associated nuclear protein 1 n=1 Tax=Didymosphaeria variabile TaxID=1932322 RepID=A0A9W9C8Q2_9PLEO|nr:NET1-associated nuclear protein 1 [Didymosphaeria variabile]KAJ4349969.1 NET1-associated nuclear protein 1 [Didymosphaeria variabile]
MADVNGTPQLKRRRESTEAQRKKAKTGKSKSAAGGESAPSKTKSASPEVKSTPKPTVTPEAKATQKKQPPPHSAQTYGTSAGPATSTPSSSRKKDKSISKTQNKDMLAEHKEDAIVAVAGMQKQVENKRERNPDPWSISAPQGGWFLPQDPVFSPDEKYLLLGKLKALDVYAADTSLLVRSLPLGASSVALAYAISPTNPDLVYVADSAGIISLWNWTDGSKLGRWGIGLNVQHLVVVEQPITSRDLVFTHEADSKHIVNVHALYTGEEASKTEVKQILRTSRPITEMQVFLQGKLVVLSTPNSMIVGKRRKFKQTALQDFEYTWREFEMSKRITTFNAFVQTSGGKDQALEDARDHLNLAVGDEEGVIYLFEDVISRLVAVEKSQKDVSDKKVGPESLTPKRLHWHRTAVRSLKYSLDGELHLPSTRPLKLTITGNYLVSGGDETVLTIWQLATGKQQHLPHLTAAIESIAISPSGASYGVTLANNSVIVLSTSELKAKTNIVGIQTRRISAGKLHRLSNPHFSPKYLTLVPMDVDPNNNKHITFVTPSSQPRHGGASRSEPYIQTFDLANQRPIARQPLTRNNATDPNMGPEGRPILEPSVNLLRISHDGAWLATVDDWVPPAADLSYIEEGISAFNAEERTLRREVYLKIWRRDEQNAQWSLDARIDAPHFIEGISAHARVFDLAADPSGAGFATVGEDRVVRIWRPKTRLRDGVIVRGADRLRGLVNWSLDHAIKLADKLEVGEAREVSQSTIPRTSRLAFSADGSVLAAGLSWATDEDPGVVHIIDTNDGSIRRSITEIDITALSGVAILGRHLILLGNTVVVWDMIMDQLVYSIPNKTPGVRIATHSQLLSLATNEGDSTFAVSTPRLQKKEPEDERFTKIATKITVYSPEFYEPIWSCTIPEALVLGLVAAKGSRGFIALDTSSNIRLITPTVGTLQLPSPPLEFTSETTEEMEVDQDDAEDVDKTALQNLHLSASEELLQASENDKPVVRPEQLQQIFDSGPSHALPPVRDLFDAVVGLYGRKLRVAAAGAA